jgi:hypothetical protein
VAGALQHLLGQEKIEIDRIERLQRDDLGARADVLAGVHFADTELASKRCAQGLLRDDRLLLGDLSLERLEIGGRHVELRAADQHPIILGLVAVEIALRKIAVGFERAKFRHVVAVAQSDDLGAGLDVAAGIEIDLIYDARDFDREIRTPHRVEGPDDIDPWHPVFINRFGGRH